MNFNTLITTISVILATISPISVINSQELKPNVVEIHSLLEIPDEVYSEKPESTLVFWDIDDTVFDSSTMLGSAKWRKYIKEATKDIPVDKNLGDSWHDIFSYDLSKFHPVTTVEPITATYIKDLQAKQYVVSGLTARECDKWYSTNKEKNDVAILTTNQLDSVGVNFNNDQLEKFFPLLVQNNKEYYAGTFFVTSDSKGEFLEILFKTFPENLPSNVVFIDDKDSQTESVAKALATLGISHTCYTYTATKNKKFNSLIANIQLWYFYQSGGKSLSNQEAKKIAEENTNLDEAYYLNLAVELKKATS